MDRLQAAQPHEPTPASRSPPYRPRPSPHGDRLRGGEARSPRLPTMRVTDTLRSVGQCLRRRTKIQAHSRSLVHREHPNAIGAPHEVGTVRMSDDLTVMGIAATAAALDRLATRPIVLRYHQRGARRTCGQRRTVKRQTSKPSRLIRLRVALAKIPGRLPPGRLRSPPAAPGPRSRGFWNRRRTTTCRRLARACWPERHGVERGQRGPISPRRITDRRHSRPVGQTRAGNPKSETDGHSSPLTSTADLQRARRSLRLGGSVMAVPPAWVKQNLRSASWRYPVPTCTGSPLRIA